MYMCMQDKYMQVDDPVCLMGVIKHDEFGSKRALVN